MRIGNPWLLVGPCWLVVTCALPARAQQAPSHELGATVELLAGYDSNPILALSPNARRDATSTLEGPGSSAVLNALGNVVGVVGRAPWLGVSLSTDARLYDSADVRQDTSLSLFTGTDLGRARLSLSTLGGRYDASFGSDDAWYGSVVPALRWSFSQWVSVGLEGHTGARHYVGGEQTNWDLGGAVDLQLRQDTWLAALGVDADRRESSDATAARAQLTPFAHVAVSFDPLQLSLRYAAYARWFDQGEQDGVEHTAELGARYRVGSLVSVSTRIGVGIARGQADALSYERWYAIAGLTFTFGSAVTRVPQVLDRSQQGAAQLGLSTTRFSVCVAGANAVSVVGTFNEWSADAGRMSRVNAECFAIELAVAAGHHRYQWMIDGVLVRPDNAPAYAPDGFGGEDAVLIVTE